MWSVVRIQSMFADGYADGMNVPETMNFFRAVVKLDSLSAPDFPTKSDLFLILRRPLRVFARLCFLEVTTLADNRPSLSMHLNHVSEQLHIIFILHRENHTAFLPNQTVRNIQMRNTAFYYSVAACQARGIEEYLIFQVNPSPLTAITIHNPCVLT